MNTSSQDLGLERDRKHITSVNTYSYEDLELKMETKHTTQGTTQDLGLEIETKYLTEIIVNTSSH